MKGTRRQLDWATNCYIPSFHFISKIQNSEFFIPTEEDVELTFSFIKQALIKEQDRLSIESKNKKDE